MWNNCLAANKLVEIISRDKALYLLVLPLCNFEAVLVSSLALPQGARAAFFFFWILISVTYNGLSAFDVIILPISDFWKAGAAHFKLNTATSRSNGAAIRCSFQSGAPLFRVPSYEFAFLSCSFHVPLFCFILRVATFQMQPSLWHRKHAQTCRLAAFVVLSCKNVLLWYRVITNTHFSSFLFYFLQTDKSWQSPGRRVRAPCV